MWHLFSYYFNFGIVNDVSSVLSDTNPNSSFASTEYLYSTPLKISVSSNLESLILLKFTVLYSKKLSLILFFMLYEIALLSPAFQFKIALFPCI